MTTALFLPREIRVAAGANGEPLSVFLKNRPRPAVAIRNAWRIDDEWWRQEISRSYFEVELAGGMIVTVFHDLVSGKWYRQ
jgi:hypothetical protein